MYLILDSLPPPASGNPSKVQTLFRAPKKPPLLEAIFVNAFHLQRLFQLSLGVLEVLEKHTHIRTHKTASNSITMHDIWTFCRQFECNYVPQEANKPQYHNRYGKIEMCK